MGCTLEIARPKHTLVYINALPNAKIETLASASLQSPNPISPNRGNGVRVRSLRTASGGGRPPPHAGASGVDHREGAPERAARGGGPVRGDRHVRRSRPAEDEVPPVPPQADEHQALPRPHPLPRPRQNPLANHPWVRKS